MLAGLASCAPNPTSKIVLEQESDDKNDTQPYYELKDLVVADTIVCGIHGEVLGLEAQPLIGANVSIKSDLINENILTDSLGQFDVQGLASDIYVLKIEQEGYESFSVDSIQLETGHFIDCEIGIKKEEK